MKNLLVCLLAALITVQAYPSQFSTNFHGRIVGGKEATPHQFPYQVGLNLYLQSGGISFCGGSILSEWYILTAAHCTDNVKMIEIVMGAHKVDDHSEATQVRMNSSIIIPHENWYPTLLLNDIAVIKTPRKIVFNANIQPITLPNTETTDYAGQNATVSGWGKTKDDSNVISPVLNYVETDVITVKRCQEIYPKVIHETHLCTSGNGGKSSCNGDSGGPLVVVSGKNVTQIGLVSFGWKTCQTGHPAVFTRLTKYLPWIQKNIAI